jgi:hypothetical protein
MGFWILVYDSFLCQETYRCTANIGQLWLACQSML